MWKEEHPVELILASQSPRRRALLEQIGMKFKAISPDVDERVDGNPSPAQLVEELSLRKARAVARQGAGQGLILAADTVVALDGAVLGKPKTEQEAFSMLSALSGNRHEVYTGLTLLQGGREDTGHEVTTVAFRLLEPEEITRYIATGEPMDKAGAYGIQGLGALLVSGIQGDYYNVMGLPLYRLGQMLAGFGVDLLALACR